MRELETKFKIDIRRDELAGALRSRGIDLTPPVHQTDFVYARSPDELLSPQLGTIVARIRIADNGITMTVKQRRASDLDRTERELNIDRPDAARDILSLLGLRELVTVEKVRQSASLDGSTSLMLDEVSGLGTFVELEVLDDSDQAEAKLDAAISVMRDLLGEDPQIVERGYDRLLLEAGGGPST